MLAKTRVEAPRRGIFVARSFCHQYVMLRGVVQAGCSALFIVKRLNRRCVHCRREVEERVGRVAAHSRSEADAPKGRAGIIQPVFERRPLGLLAWEWLQRTRLHVAAEVSSTHISRVGECDFRLRVDARGSCEPVLPDVARAPRIGRCGQGGSGQRAATCAS